MTVGTVYKVINSEDDMIYIGSTMTPKLSHRMGDHRSKARDVQTRTSKLYVHMRKVGIDKFSIVSLVCMSDVTRAELEAAEFKEMTKRNPKRLLNMNTELGKHCQEHTERLIKAGTESWCFKRGSIFLINRVRPCGRHDHSVLFRWSTRINNKSVLHQKSWSIKVHGEMVARSLAEKFRDSTYPV
jgi:predicted GIY-YIG superfamily endonuclease